MKRELLEALLAAARDKRPVALVTDLESGEQWLLEAETARRPTEQSADAQRAAGERSSVTPAPPGLPEALLSEAGAALRADRARPLELGGRRLFLNPFNPPLRMIVVGAVHIAQSLAPLATLAGFEVHVVDPRETFAAALRFPGVAISRQWPDEALAELAPDARTAVVTLTHDPKLDDPALSAALGSEAFYIGSLGSRRTHAGRLERLREAGFGEDALARIRGPVGLPIGARTPAEIAVSIVAEAVRELRGAG